MAENIKLDGHHRVTGEDLPAPGRPQHPVARRAVPPRERGHGGDRTGRQGQVTLGSETETFDPPRHHDIGEQMVVDLRRMLEGAGIGPATG